MSVAIRLSRQGKKKAPFYRIVAADKRKARDGKFIELLGTYDPRSKAFNLDGERYAKWIKNGAQPSGTLATLVRKQIKASKAKAA
ncbi:MAG: 30S ribosomal protein S16 [Kofleriaceae bacterium]|jgi:small subunit ribosomal protein S16|nr:30S ribosomal protein S16 [Kofleriaceae bacterium]